MDQIEWCTVFDAVEYGTLNLRGCALHKPEFNYLKW